MMRYIAVTAVLMVFLIGESSTFSLYNLRDLIDDAIDQQEKRSYPYSNFEKTGGNEQLFEKRNSIQEIANQLAKIAQQIAQANLAAEIALAPAKASKAVAGKGK